MSGNARLFILALGVAALAGGLLLSVAAEGGGIPLLILGGMVMASLGFERRYGRPGAPTSTASHDWRLTGERFLDDETGEPLEVWMDPLTGERRYEPVGKDPRLLHRRP